MATANRNDRWDPRDMEFGDDLIIKDGAGKDIEFCFLACGYFEEKHYLTCADVVEDGAPFDPDDDMIVYLVEWEFDADGRPCFTLVEDDERIDRVLGLFEHTRLADIVESYPCIVTATGSIDTYRLTNQTTGEKRIALLTHNCVTISGVDYVIFNVVGEEDDELKHAVFRRKDEMTGDYDAVDEETRAGIAAQVEELIEEWADLVVGAAFEDQEAAS